MKILSTTVSGVKTNKQLEHWIPMCKSWAFNIERYTRLTELGDAPYYYNERANVGLLAGAAWSCGNIALEEFQSIKGTGNNERHGRIDLWICSENGTEEYIEAKYKCMSLKGDYLTHIKSTLDEAVEAANFSRGDGEIDGVGIAFIVFFIKENPISDIIKALDFAIQEVSSNVEHDLLSWCYPERDMKHVYDDGYIVPGILMVAKKCEL